VLKARRLCRKIPATSQHKSVRTSSEDGKEEKEEEEERDEELEGGGGGCLSGLALVPDLAPPRLALALQSRLTVFA